MGALFDLSMWDTVKSIVRKQMKTENRKQRMRRFNGSLETRTVRGRERESERENTESSVQKKTLTQYNALYMCVCSMHTYIQVLTGLTEVLSYFNALKERLHKLPKYIPNGISFFASFASFASFGSLCRTCASDRYQPIRYSA